ncbi:FHA domain-containing protein [Actinokineospora auranticolor]|uniref:FHA domain-containing protein n=1 Tax=Actinokineospora auranticolor TaxID=155976 RepID=A0A2S6GKU8_9PSEU|nr:FHA domain-containing protein [Actinokineospora auranticolor]PPK65862.1 FHA domain-containing protein [Actinokineospora auranticolor]
MGEHGVSRVWRRGRNFLGKPVEDFWNRTGDAGEAVVVERVSNALRVAATRGDVWHPTVVVRLSAGDYDLLEGSYDEVRGRLSGLICGRLDYRGVSVGVVRIVLEPVGLSGSESFTILTAGDRDAVFTRAEPPPQPDPAPRQQSFPRQRPRPDGRPTHALRSFSDGSRIPLGGVPVTLGRAQGAPGRLDDPKASRRHCELVVRADGRLTCTDHSSNGTKVDGQRITGTVTLSVGQVLRAGRTEWVVEHW